MSWLADHLLLSLLWLVACLPVVTAPIATAALFEVTRQRAGGADPPLVRAFSGALRAHLTRALPLGYAWTALGGVLVVDLGIAGRMGAPAGDLVRVAVLALLLLYALASVTLFPVLVSYRTMPRLLPVLWTTLVVALLFPIRSLLGVAVVAAAGLTVWTVPLLLVVVPAVVAGLLHRLCGSAFELLRARAGGEPGTGRPAPLPVPH